MSRNLHLRSTAYSLVTALIASLLAFSATPASAAQSAWQNTESVTTDVVRSRDSVASSSGGTFVAWTTGTEVKLRYRPINSTFGSEVLVDSGLTPRGIKLVALANNAVGITWLDGTSSSVEVNYAQVSGSTVSGLAQVGTFSNPIESQYGDGFLDLSANANGEISLSMVSSTSSGNRSAHVAIFDGSAWGALTQVSQTEIYVNDAWNIMRADGSVVLVFMFINTSTWNSELRSAVFNGTAWSTPNTFTLSAGSGNEAEPIVGPDGTIHVVWSAYSSPRKVGYATMATSASTFTSEMLSTSSSAQFGELAVAPNGEVSIAYISGGNTAQVITKPSGGTWGADYAAASSNTSTVAEGYSRINAEYTSDNRLIVTWTSNYDGTNRDIYASVRSAAGTWGNAQMLTASQTQFDMNSVVVTGTDGTAMVHWQDAYGPVHTATLNVGSDTFTTQTDPGTTNSARQSYARVGAFIDGDGEGTFVFEGSSQGINFATTDVAGPALVIQNSWQNPIDAVATAPNYGSAAQAGNGDLYFAWTDAGVVKYVYRAAGTSFSTERSLSTSNAIGARLATDSTGAVRLFYLDGNSSTTHIYTATAANGTFGSATSLGSMSDGVTHHTYPSEPITVTVGPSGKLLVTAIFNTSSYSRYVVATAYNGSSWSTLTTISGSDGYVNETYGAIRADGTYMVMFIGYNPGPGVQEGKTTFWDGTSWSSPTVFNSGRHIAGITELVQLANDDIVFGYTGINSNIRYTYSALISAGTTSVNTAVVGRSDHLLAPQITKLSNDEVILAYVGRNPDDLAAGTLYINTITRTANGTWGAAARVAATDTETYGESYSRFAIETTSDDTVVIAWTTPWVGSGFGLKAAIRPSGGSFSSPIDLGVGNNPTILVNASSPIATMFWLEGSTNLKTVTLNEGESTFTTEVDHGVTSNIFGAFLQSNGDAHLFANQSGVVKFASTSTSSIVAPSMHTISIDLSGDGEGAVTNDQNNTACTADCSFQVVDGTAIEITATAGSLDEFAAWSGQCSGNYYVCSFTVSADVVVGAEFNEVHQLPVVTTAPTITGDAVEEETLTASWATWNWTGRTSFPTFTLVWQRSTDGTVWTTIANTQDETTYTLTSADAGKLIRVLETATNVAGTVESASLPTDEVVALEADQCLSAVTPPAGQVGVSINQGGLYTTSRSVTIKAVWDDCRSHALISNDGGFSNATRVVLPVNGQISWTLPNTGSDRLPKTVYVKFESPDGSYSQTLTDDIILDMTAPTVASIAKQTKVKRNYVTKIKATDSSSGVYSVYFYDKNKKAIKAITYRNATTSITIGTKKAVYIRLKDRAGNYTKYLSIR